MLSQVAQHKASLGIAIAVLALGVGLMSMAQRPPVLVRSAIAGVVLGEGLARVNQDVKQGDPLVYVQSRTDSRSVLAAVAPVDGRVVRITVRPGSHINIGDIVGARSNGHKAISEATLKIRCSPDCRRPTSALRWR